MKFLRHNLKGTLAIMFKHTHTLTHKYTHIQKTLHNKKVLNIKRRFVKKLFSIARFQYFALPLIRPI